MENRLRKVEAILRKQRDTLIDRIQDLRAEIKFIDKLRNDFQNPVLTSRKELTDKIEMIQKEIEFLEGMMA